MNYTIYKNIDFFGPNVYIVTNDLSNDVVMNKVGVGWAKLQEAKCLHEVFLFIGSIHEIKKPKLVKGRPDARERPKDCPYCHLYLTNYQELSQMRNSGWLAE